MATTNILLFDQNKQNMMQDDSYSTFFQRLNGVQSGVADSSLHNKTLYQLSLVAYAIAQIMNKNGLNANDTDLVSTFVSNLSSALLQKVSDKASSSEISEGTANDKWVSPSDVKSMIGQFSVPIIKNNINVLTTYFESDSTYSDFPYKATVPVTGVSDQMFPIVVFSPEDVVKERFASISSAGENELYLYSKDIPEETVIIPTIVFFNL